MPSAGSMSADQMRAAIDQLETCAREMERVNPHAIGTLTPEPRRLASKHNQTLQSVFGRDTPEYRRASITVASFRPRNPRVTQRERDASFAKGQREAAAKLRAEVETLRELLLTLTSSRSPSGLGTAAVGTAGEIGVSISRSSFGNSSSGGAAEVAVPGAEPIAAPIVISSTIYPSGPGGTVIVANSITININAPGFRDFTTTVDELLDALGGSNEASSEVKEQLTRELLTGIEATKVPKADRGTLQKYLVHPLQFIAKTFTSDVIHALATRALETLASIAHSLFS